MSFSDLPKDVVSKILCFSLEKRKALPGKSAGNSVEILKRYRELCIVSKLFYKASSNEFFLRYLIEVCSFECPEHLFVGGSYLDVLKCEVDYARARKKMEQEARNRPTPPPVPCGMRRPQMPGPPPLPVLNSKIPKDFKSFVGLNEQELQRVRRR